MRRWAKRGRQTLTDALRLRPSFLIIGAQRAGTTSLYNYLAGHPSIRPAARKELHFFDRQYSDGLTRYYRQFPVAIPGGPRRITGEATPYYLYHPLAAARVRQALPAVRLIVLLRNPLDRALSHYHHTVQQGAEPLTFEEAIEQEPARLAGEHERLCREPGYISAAHVQYSYLARGVYVDQLEQWMDIFPREQFLILKSEEFMADPAAAVRTVGAFLGLPPAETGPYPPHNRQEYAAMNSATRTRLLDYFAPHNARLYHFLNRDFGWDH